MTRSFAVSSLTRYEAAHDSAPRMTRLQVLYERSGLPRFDLPSELIEAYGGELGFGRPRLVANFVSTIDGVVAIPGLAQSNKLISDASDSDRFVMGLLRACADAVVVGSGTLRASPRGLWTAERAYAAGAQGFAELRRRRDRPAHPERVVLTATGSVPTWHPLFANGALVLTTDTGASRLDGRLPRASTLLALGGSETVDVNTAIATLRRRGHELILSEAGPRVFGSLVEAALVDELFLTVSPLLAGRAHGERLALVEGFEALPGERVDGRVLSIRRARGHVFLRYGLDSRQLAARDGSTDPKARS
jgi:riboflavin biosynthesis pyrimidine reductase